MRIAFVTLEYPPFMIGGACTYAKNITENIAKMGHEIVVFTSPVEDHRKSDIETLKIVNVEKIKKLPFKSLNFSLGLPSAIKQAEKKFGKFDIIHFNGFSYWFLKKKLSEAPHLITIHHLTTGLIKDYQSPTKIQDETNFLNALIEKRCIRSVDKIIAISKFTRDQIAKTYGIPHHQIEVTYLGVDTDAHNFTMEELEITKKNLGLKNKPIALFVGRVDDPRKGLDILLNVYKNVLKEIDATLLVVGSGDQNNTVKLAESLGISKNVVFTGFVDDLTLKKCYSLCDVYVCPSRLEGFGLTLLDAMAVEKPIIATNAGSLPEVLEDYNLKAIVDGNDTKSFAEVLIQFLKGLDPNLQKKNVLENKFTWTKSAELLDKIYKEII